MEKLSKREKIKAFYESKIGSGLPDYAVLGWEGREAQYKRFDALTSLVDLDGRKLLDVGCGLGNLLEYLNGKGIRVQYTGVDISEKMVACVKAKDLPGEFHCVDVFKENPFPEEAFDVVFASGIFNISLGNNREFLANGLTRFFELSRRFVVFNLLHVNSPDREDRFYYFSPEEVVQILKELPFNIRRTEITEGYLKNDFTTLCEKGDIKK